MKTRISALLLFFFTAIINAGAVYFPYTVTVTTSKTYDALPGNATVLAAANTALTKVTKPIGFNFRYYGQLQDQVSINQNGQISFSGFVQKDFVDAVCATLQPTATSQIACGVIGTSPSRIFIVEWKNMNIKNSNLGTANTTFHIELHEGSGIISMMYSLAPPSYQQVWFNEDGNGLIMEIADIPGLHDLVFGTNLTTPQENDHAGSTALRFGYTAFPAAGTEYAFQYNLPSNAPNITIISPKTGQIIGHAPVAFWWTSTSADKVKIIADYGGNQKPIATVLSGKTPYYWNIPFVSADFNLIIEDSANSAIKATVNTLQFDQNGIDQENFEGNTIIIYPNPSSGSANIDIRKLTEKNANGKLIVSNMMGQVVYMQALEAQKPDIISLSNLKKGLYIVNLQLRELSYTSKLIVQ
jgi:hypothetical protein